MLPSGCLEWGLRRPRPIQSLMSIGYELELNLFGPLYAIQAVVPVMRQGGGGLNLNVSSTVTKRRTTASLSRAATRAPGTPVRPATVPPDLRPPPRPAGRNRAKRRALAIRRTWPHATAPIPRLPVRWTYSRQRRARVQGASAPDTGSIRAPPARLSLLRHFRRSPMNRPPVPLPRRCRPCPLRGVSIAATSPPCPL